jgi:hypothetical protein
MMSAFTVCILTATAIAMIIDSIFLKFKTTYRHTSQALSLTITQQVHSFHF